MGKKKEQRGKTDNIINRKSKIKKTNRKNNTVNVQMGVFQGEVSLL